MRAKDRECSTVLPPEIWEETQQSNHIPLFRAQSGEEDITLSVHLNQGFGSDQDWAYISGLPTVCSGQVDSLSGSDSLFLNQRRWYLIAKATIRLANIWNIWHYAQHIAMPKDFKYCHGLPTGAFVSISVSSAAITRYHRWVAQTADIYFSHFWRLGSPKPRCQHIQFLVKALFLAYRQ